MKRFLIALILGTFVLSYAEEAPKPKMLLFMRDAGPKAGDLEYMLEREVFVMIAALEESGFAVVVATLDGEDVVAGDQSLECDIKLENAKIENYAGFMLPCLSAPSYPAPPYVAPEAEKMVKDAVAAGKPVAAQVGSVWTLAKAGVLKGKEFAYTLRETHSYFNEAIWKGDGVVRDGLVMTSGICPWVELKMGGKEHSEELALTLAEAMKENLPTTDVICVKVPLINLSAKLRVQLFNVAGRLMYNGIAKPTIGIKHIIPIAGLPNGAYVVKITDGKEINLSSKYVLMR
jgi:putative intracellular protease/amidase